MRRRGLLILLACVVGISLMLFTSSKDMAQATESIYSGYIDSSYGAVDGHLQGEDIANTYEDARTLTASSYPPSYTGTSFRVGQLYDGVSTYYIWRAGLFFDTTALPTNITINSATIEIYCRYDYSTTNFDIAVVSGSVLHVPLADNDYGDLLSSPPDFGTVTTGGGSWSLVQYIPISLDVNGIGEIIPGGVTRFALRSDHDIGDIAPTDLEYVELYGTERGYGFQPRLVIDYSVNDIGNPDEFYIGKVQAYTNFLEEDDMVFVCEYKVGYSYGLPNLDPQEYFLIQLLDPSDVVIHQTRIRQWGYRPGSIYLSPNEASMIEWQGDYELRLTGDPLRFTVPPTVDFTLSDLTDWPGWKRGLIAWGLESAKAMSLRDTGNSGNYTAASQYSSQGEALNDAGGNIFVTGIPGLDKAVPELFQSTVWTPERNDAAEGAHAGQVNANARFGVQVLTIFQDVGNIFNLSANTVGGIIMTMLYFSCVGAAFVGVGSPPGAIAVGLPIIGAGMWLGVIPIVVGAVIASLCVLLIVWMFWLRST